MEKPLSVLLYSKYSEICKNILNALQDCPINLNSHENFEVICIDNEKIRKKIINNKKIQVSVVPTILVVNPTGLVEKYEGDEVINWIDQTVSKYMPQIPEPQPQPQPQPQPKPKPKPPITKKPKPKPPPSKNIQENEDEDEDDEDEYEEEQEIIRKPKKIDQMNLQDIDEKIPSDMKRPPAPIRSGPGNYDLTNDFGEEIITERKEPVKNQQQTGDLMATALAMQKEREE